MTYGPIQRNIGQKHPRTPEEAVTFLQKEMIPSYLQLKSVVDALAAAFNNGSLTIAGYTFYVDAADRKLKAKGPDGTITVVANP